MHVCLSVCAYVSVCLCLRLIVSVYMHVCVCVFILVHVCRALCVCMQESDVYKLSKAGGYLNHIHQVLHLLISQMIQATFYEPVLGGSKLN